MELFHAFLRLTDTKKYLPYAFYGNIIEEEKERIIAILLKHHPALVSATFNDWHFAKYSSGRWYLGRRTWETGDEQCDNIDEVCAFLERYFK